MKGTVNSHILCMNCKGLKMLRGICFYFVFLVHEYPCEKIHVINFVIKLQHTNIIALIMLPLSYVHALILFNNYSNKHLSYKACLMSISEQKKNCVYE